MIVFCGFFVRKESALFIVDEVSRVSHPSSMKLYEKIRGVAKQ